MKLLLDTHLLLWAAAETDRLPKAARRLISDERNELIFSAVSLWEITIKQGVDRTELKINARRLHRSLVENGYLELPVTSEHAFAIASLPMIHKDPFDRLLVAQATVEGATLLTSDSVLAKYAGPVELV